MKATITTLVLFTLSILNSQTKNKTADALFDKMYYVKAAKSYEMSIKNGDVSKEALQRIGDAYYFNTQMEDANKWYEKLISDYSEEIEPEYFFRYAQSLKGIRNYELAKKWMKTFASKQKSTDTRTRENDLKSIKPEDSENIEMEFVLRNLDINSAYSDIGPMFYNGDLVYSTTIDSSFFKTNRYGWNDQPFLNLQLGKISKDQSNVSFKEHFGKDITTQYHEACVAFSPDEKTIYFTRNNYSGKLKRDSHGINNLKIYSATAVKKGDSTIQWKDVKELPFNSDDYSVGQPSVSKDGKKLYFVSDMPGSIGATDIFVVDILGDNQFSNPRNLGAKINTSGREMFPFITDKALYFASDGFPGLGGLDVFESRLSEDTFESPSHLPAPLNSNLDDFGYIIKEETNHGFVCSNRKTGKGDDDIYSFERFCKRTINGYVFDDTSNKRISAAAVILKDQDGLKIDETISEIDGKYEFKKKVECDKTYTIEAIKESYKNNIVTAGIAETPIGLSPVIVAITEKVPPVLPITSPLIVNDKGVLKIKVGIIHFDLDKFNIKKKAAIELNKVVALMKEYPDMTIKIESHTDSRGNDKYNLTLSDKRAKSTRDYIVSQKIARARIESAIGYGETQLVNDCSNGVPCSDEEHQENRRSEFIITKM